MLRQKLITPPVVITIRVDGWIGKPDHTPAQRRNDRRRHAAPTDGTIARARMLARHKKVLPNDHKRVTLSVTVLGHLLGGATATPRNGEAGEDSGAVADVFGNVYAQCIELMAGRAAERMLLDAEPVLPMTLGRRASWRS
jgi:hypothetical protein